MCVVGGQMGVPGRFVGMDPLPVVFLPRLHFLNSQHVLKNVEYLLLDVFKKKKRKK